MSLVATEEEARRTQTRLLWQGQDQRQLDEFSTALQDAGIPYFTEAQNDGAQMWTEALVGVLKAVFWKFGAFRKRKVELLASQIKVLERDYDQAQQAIRRVRQEESAED